MILAVFDPHQYSHRAVIKAYHELPLAMHPVIAVPLWRPKRIDLLKSKGELHHA
jgi:hypothetical protein